MLRTVHVAFSTMCYVVWNFHQSGNENKNPDSFELSKSSKLFDFGYFLHFAFSLESFANIQIV